jgi:hypothetical protein
MTSNDSKSTLPVSITGTLGDYSEDLYRHFFEVADTDGIAKGVFLKYLGAERSVLLRAVDNGYELDIPIQCAPELVRLLAKDNIAVYQVVRLAKSEGRWRP